MFAAFRVSNDVADVPEAIAWKLVESLYAQAATLVVGACLYIGLGCIGFYGTGSPWYLAGAAASFLVCAWRLLQVRQYQLHRDSASPLHWARRARRSAWLTGAVWGAWSFVIPFETEPTLDFILICVQSTCVTAGAVRNNGLPAVAIGQMLMALTPPVLICAFSPSTYLNVFAPFVVLNFLGGVALTKFMHHQTLRLLLVSQEKTALLDQLQATNQELTVINQHLETLATTDALTDLANRRVFDLTLAQEWKRHARKEAPLSLLLLDVDHFKQFNDLYGHPAGDQCLRGIAAMTAAAIRRSSDVVARYGGEEFAVILPDTFLDEAVLLADRILADVIASRTVHRASPFGHVTVSIGVACLIPDHDAAPTDLTAAADIALYAAKRKGRNAVHAASAPLAGKPVTLPGLV